MSNTNSDIDKVALENAAQTLTSLSQSTYIIFALFVPLGAGILFPNDSQDIDIGVAKLKSDVIPYVVFPLLIAVIFHSCHCMSILEQFIDEKRRVAPIQTATTQSIIIKIITHHWPFNPFSDFLRYPNSIITAENSENFQFPRGHRLRLIWRFTLAYIPFFGAYLLVLTYMFRVIKLERDVATVAIIIVSFILFIVLSIYYMRLINRMLAKLTHEKTQFVHSFVHKSIVLLALFITITFIKIYWF